MPEAVCHDTTIATDDERLATIEDYASIEFEPWTEPGADDWRPMSNSDWLNPILVMIRVAWHTMHHSKEEIIGWWEEDGELWQNTCDNLRLAEGDLKAALSVIEGAQARLLAAASAFALKSEA